MSVSELGRLTNHASQVFYNSVFKHEEIPQKWKKKILEGVRGKVKQRDFVELEKIFRHYEVHSNTDNENVWSIPGKKGDIDLTDYRKMSNNQSLAQDNNNLLLDFIESQKKVIDSLTTQLTSKDDQINQLLKLINEKEKNESKLGGET